MPRVPFERMQCSVARTLDVIGDRWTPLVLRDLFVGITRFDAIQNDLGISRKVLAERLNALLDNGVIERTPYQDNPARFDYALTDKGTDLAFVLLAMQAWGDRWVFGDAGAPMLLRHDRCKAVTHAIPTCSHCGEPLTPEEVTLTPGPSARAGPGTQGIQKAFERLAVGGRAQS